jgi:serine/threonine protein phosphatase PrpC
MCLQSINIYILRTLAGQSGRKKMKINQDSMILKKHLCSQMDWHLFGVFDGHG